MFILKNKKKKISFLRLWTASAATRRFSMRPAYVLSESCEPDALVRESHFNPSMREGSICRRVTRLSVSADDRLTVSGRRFRPSIETQTQLEFTSAG